MAGRGSVALLLLGMSGCLSQSSYSNADLAGSSISTSANFVLADGSDTATLQIVTRRSDGLPLQNLWVQVHADACTVTQPAAPTDANGLASATIASLSPGQHEVTASISFEGFSQTLSPNVVINFVTPLGLANATVDVPADVQLLLQGSNVSGQVGFVGTVHFTSSDPAAALPAPQTLTASQFGYVYIPGAVTFRTAGLQVLQAFSASGTQVYQQAYQVSPAAAARLLVAGDASPWVAGSPHTVSVTAVDSFNNVVTGFTDSIQLVSSDANAQLPASAPASVGTQSFTGVVLRTAGTQTLGARDPKTALLVSVPLTIQVQASVAFTLQVSLPASVTAGVATPVSVQVEDALGNPLTNVNDSITLTSSDPQAQLPAALQVVDGVGSGSVTFGTAGTQVLHFGGALSANQNCLVVPGPTDHFDLTGIPATVSAGATQTLTVRAVDAFDNTVAGYLGVVATTSSDPHAVLPSVYSFSASDAGQHDLTAELSTAGPQTITVTDVVTQVTGATSTTVQAASTTAGLILTGLPASSVAGSASSVTVRAVDAYGNTSTSYQGTVHFSSTDPRAVLPADAAFTSGQGGTQTWPAGVQLLTAGVQTVTVADGGGLTANQNNLVVVAGAATTLQFSSQPPQNANACSQFSAAVVATDYLGNAVPWTAPVSLSLRTVAGSAAATLVGTSVQTPVSGQAVFSSLSIVSGGGSYALVAQSATLTAAQSTTIVLTATNAVVSLGAPVGTQGTISFPFTVQAACPVSLEFAFDPTGAGVFAAATALSGSSSTVALRASSPVAGTFLWDSTHDMLRATSTTAVMQVTARSNGTVATAQQTAVQVQNGTTYGAPQTVATNAAQTCVALADFNHDAVADLLTCDTTNNALQIHLGVTGGTFNPMTSSGAGTAPSSVVVADVNRDGNLDAVVTNPGSNQVNVLTGTGTGSFAATFANALGTNPVAVGLADINHDGILDFIVANGSTSRLTWANGTGTGHIAAASHLATGTTPVAMVVADFNGDSNPDAVVANAAGTLSIFLGNGAGFAAAASMSLGATPAAIAVGDLNIDGQPDLLVTLPNSVEPLYGNGDGTFFAASPVTVNNVVGAKLCDIDRDGNLDGVARTTTGVEILYGSRTTTLATPVALGGAPAANDFVCADVNQDSLPDLLTVNASASFTLIAGTTVQSAAHGLYTARVTDMPQLLSGGIPGDFNNDGRMDFLAVDNADHLVVLFQGDGAGNLQQMATWPVGANVPSEAAGDFNGDGNLDVALPSAVNGIIYLFMGDGAGHFTISVTPYVGSSAYSIAATDVNNDGKIDLLVTVILTNSVAVLLNDGLANFSIAQTIIVDPNPVGLDVADINHDGFVDMVTTNNGTTSANTLFGDGTGNFTGLVRSAGINGERLRLADFDGDGFVDIGTNWPGAIDVSFGDGTGAFTPTISEWGGGWTSDIDTGDLNRDGRMDFVMPGTVIISVFGTADRSASAANAAGTYHSVRIADFNGDGWPDVVLTHQWSPNIKVVLNDGTGHFPQPSSNGSLGNDSVLCDLNHDGTLDEVTVSDGSAVPPVPMSVSYAYGDGYGLFNTTGWANGVSGVFWSTSIVAGDINNDGWADVIADDNYDGAIVVWLNTPGAGSLTFSSQISFSSPGDMALVDINRDGKLDLVVASTNGPVEVALGNGTGGFGSFTNFTTAASGPLAVADVDNNGTLDIAVVGSDQVLVKLINTAGNPVGGTTANSVIPFVGASTVSIIDVNNDGKLDIVANISDGSFSAALGAGNGTFATPNSIIPAIPGESPGRAIMGDVNMDGKPDLVMLSVIFGDIIVAYGQPGGTLAPPIVYMANGIALGRLWLNDFNHDGLNDILASITSLSGGNGWVMTSILGK